MTEEIVMRWGAMSLLCWVGLRVLPPAAAYWSAIALSALLFAAAHLPAALALGPLPDVLVLRIMLLNTLAGVVFGWLYWRYTLECAMIAHASVHGMFLFERLVL